MTSEMTQIFAESIQHVASKTGVQLGTMNKTEFMAFGKDHHAAICAEAALRWEAMKTRILNNMNAAVAIVSEAAYRQINANQ